MLNSKSSLEFKCPNLIIQDAIKFAKPFYCNTNRFYHNWSHIEGMLSPHDPYNLSLAIIFHDIFKGIHSPENSEIGSANIFEEWITRNYSPSFYNEEDIYLVKELILATKEHNLSEYYLHPTLAEHFNLFEEIIKRDLFILTTNRKSYLEYANKIRFEYSYYGDEDYKKGRILFLDKMKDKLIKLDMNAENLKYEKFLLENNLFKFDINGVI